MITPQSIIDETEKIKADIETKKLELEEQMGLGQEKFKNTLESLAKSIQQFYNYNKKEHHAEISEKVKVINEALVNVATEARKFNSRENLFEREITDYSKIQEMSKDFLPYSHLWLTTTNWVQNR